LFVVSLLSLSCHVPGAHDLFGYFVVGTTWQANTLFCPQSIEKKKSRKKSNVAVADSTVVGTATVPSKACPHPMNEKMVDLYLDVVPDNTSTWTIGPGTSPDRAENTIEPKRTMIPSKRKVTENIVHADDDDMIKAMISKISCLDIDNENPSVMEAAVAIDAVETHLLLVNSFHSLA
jgi:hypothetical protein